MARDIVTLDPIWGLPPDTFVSNHMIHNSMPVAYLTPMVPQASLGLGLYRTVKAWKQYNDLLNVYGFALAKQPIKVAFLAENFPTDSFQNEYGESFINKITDIASQGAGDIAQVMGVRSAGEGIKKMGEMLSATGQAMGTEGIGGMVGGLLSKAGQAGIATVGAGRAALDRLSKMNGAPAGAANAINLISRMMAGARIDFPQVWKNSGFTPSYSMTIRLYNPKPGSEAATKKYIVGPIIALLLLGTPQTQDGSTYNWPFLQNVECPGVFSLTPSYIGSIAVVKGGDQQSIAFNQNLAIVDVRMDFGSLYNSMIAGKINLANKSRPTLKTYMDTLLQADVKKSVESVYSDPEGHVVTTPRPIPVTKQIAPTRTDTTTTPVKRVSDQTESLYQRLLNKAKGLIHTPSF